MNEKQVEEMEKWTNRELQLNLCMGIDDARVAQLSDIMTGFVERIGHVLGVFREIWDPENELTFSERVFLTYDLGRVVEANERSMDFIEEVY